MPVPIVEEMDDENSVLSVSSGRIRMGYPDTKIAGSMDLVRLYRGRSICFFSDYGRRTYSGRSADISAAGCVMFLQR